jgi:isoleucyl-tRNA synthetase
VVDSYRRIRNTLRFLLANTSDFDAAKDAVPLGEMLEIDRWALARASQFQDEVLAHYEAYEFHPVVAKLQLFCSEDLGAFYLDVLKDRLYTTGPKSRARRSAQTALWHITQAMLRWMAPFLSFTAEEAWQVFAPERKGSIFVETYWKFPLTDASLLHKWWRLQKIRGLVNKQMEVWRISGYLGASLQAEVDIWVDGEAHELLASLGDELKFLLIASRADVHPYGVKELELGGGTIAIQLGSLEIGGSDFGMFSQAVNPSTATKCDRCWHYRADVGTAPAHPTICGRCVSNLFGDGEIRTFA